MATSPNAQLTTWLNTAYSMEQSLEHVLQNHAKDAKDHPEMQSRIEQHLAETRNHAERVKDALALLGETPSTVKSLIGNITGMVQAPSTGVFRDETVKNVLSDYAAEQFEIACYRSLIAAAEELGKPEVAALCRQNLVEDEAMAAWLDEQIPVVTRLTLQEQTTQV